MRMNSIPLILTAIVLSGCLASEKSLFPASEAAKSVLAKNYVVTDGESPLGEITLTENDGQYTIVEVKNNIGLEEGWTFQLFPAQAANHPIERNWGPLRYFWLQGEKTDEPGFIYELLGITTRDLEKGVVFRWGLWTFNKNELFAIKLQELAASSDGQMNCDGEDGISCSLESKEFLQQVSEIISETEKTPYRAYVPR